MQKVRDTHAVSKKKKNPTEEMATKKKLSVMWWQENSCLNEIFVGLLYFFSASFI